MVRLREQAAKARRLARTIAGDPVAQNLKTVADQLDAEAESVDTESAEPPAPKP